MESTVSLCQDERDLQRYSNTAASSPKAELRLGSRWRWAKLCQRTPQGRAFSLAGWSWVRWSTGRATEVDSIWFLKFSLESLGSWQERGWCSLKTTTKSKTKQKPNKTPASLPHLPTFRYIPPPFQKEHQIQLNIEVIRLLTKNRNGLN